MRKILYFPVIIILASLLFSCADGPKQNGLEMKRVKQQIDGTIALSLDKADCYSDMSDPSANAAEWQVVISKSGRYDVWLSSATKDTTDLNYKNSVLISLHNNRIEAKPLCDRIIVNSGEVSFPWFRADSFLGSMYIQDTGTFHVQVISEKILPNGFNVAETSAEDISRLISVSFKPVSN